MSCRHLGVLNSTRHVRDGEESKLELLQKSLAKVKKKNCTERRAAKGTAIYLLIISIVVFGVFLQY